MKRVLLINPNTSAEITDKLRAHISPVLAGCAQVTAVTAPFGAPYISDEVSYAVAALACVQAYNDAVQAQGVFDAVLIGCFGDPGLFALRELCCAPVLGLAEASMREARARGAYTIVTGGERWRPILLRLALALDLHDQLHNIVTVAPTGAQLAADPQGARQLLAAACQDAAAHKALVSVIVGGAGLAGVAEQIAAQVPIPLIDSVQAAARAVRAALQEK
jgi:allantoin racemase